MDDYKSNQVFKWQVRRSALANGGADQGPGPATNTGSTIEAPQSNIRGHNINATPVRGWKRVGPKKPNHQNHRQATRGPPYNNYSRNGLTQYNYSRLCGTRL